MALRTLVVNTASSRCIVGHSNFLHPFLRRHSLEFRKGSCEPTGQDLQLLRALAVRDKWDFRKFRVPFFTPQTRPSFMGP